MIEARIETIFRSRMHDYRLYADRTFGVLMPIQYAFAVLWGYLYTPLTYDGTRSSMHPHLIAALVLGGLIAIPVSLLTLLRPGRSLNPYLVAVGQMLMGGLLIHLTDGRIETHFHVFVSLAFLSFYRDWRVLVPATVVAAADHFLRGLYLPRSIYGVASGAEYRALEHAAWVIFEDIGLGLAMRESVRAMRHGAAAQAQVEATSRRIAELVAGRSDDVDRNDQEAAQIVDRAFDAIFALDADGTIRSANPAAAAMLGTDRARLVGRPFSRYLAPSGHAAEMRWTGLAHDARNGKSLRLMLQMNRGDGETFHVELTLAAGEKGFLAYVREPVALPALAA